MNISDMWNDPRERRMALPMTLACLGIVISAVWANLIDSEPPPGLEQLTIAGALIIGALLATWGMRRAFGGLAAAPRADRVGYVILVLFAVFGAGVLIGMGGMLLRFDAQIKRAAEEAARQVRREAVAAGTAASAPWPESTDGISGGDDLDAAGAE